MRLAAAAALTALPVDREVAELAGVAGRTAVEPSVEDEPAADPGRDRQVDEVPDATCTPGPEPVLGKRTRRRVVLDDRRPIEGALHHGHERHVVPAGQAGRGLDDPAERVERSAAGDADRTDR